MANFFAELKRRHIYRVGAAYVVVAWALTQLVEILTQVFTLPLWIAQAAIVLLAIGFPLALFIAWTIESKPHHAIASVVRSKPTIVDWTLCGAVAVLIALSGYRLIAPSSDATAPQVGVDAAREAAASQASAISLAVLPFANLSGDVSQEFFSDGMTAEITTALARVQGLTVIGRTSAFEFKGQNRDLRMIGLALSATHLIEGSVRKAGDRVRITAQLINTSSGAHLWTESYDRELTDIFAIQEDIAQAIAGALRVPLGLAQNERLVSNRIEDVGSYQQYLQAKALVRGRGLARLTDAAALLERVVASDRSFAPAWALLAQAYALIPIFHPASNSSSVEEFRRIVDGSLPKAEAAARRSIELDPSHADGYMALGLVQDERGKFAFAEELYGKALALDSNNPDALFRQGLLLAKSGRVKEALAQLEKLRTLEPFVPIYNASTARLLAINGRDDEAIALLKALPTDDRVAGPVILAQIYAAAGRYIEAADALMAYPLEDYAPGVREAAARVLRMAPTAAASPQTLPHLGDLGFVYNYVGAPARVLDTYEDNVEAGYLNPVSTLGLWHPTYEPVRKTQRFKTFARNAGLVDYWRMKSWPEVCRPVGADDFVCE